MSTTEQIAAVRRFSRFYTTRIGLLEDRLLASPHSLTEGRVLYEVAHDEGTTLTDIARELGVDPGYMSRVVRGLVRKGLLARRRSEEDRRRQLLTLTPEGLSAVAELETASDNQIRALLTPLDAPSRTEVVSAMASIEQRLGEGAPPRYTLRPHRPGDVGWVVERHGVLYSASHGWGAGFEAMCAEIGARFLERYDPTCERSWIAELGGARVGAVFLARRSKTVGQLRFLFVEPSARGLGLGARLVSECVGHARHVGYRKMVLFTVRGLDAARKLYEAEGFELANESPGEGWCEGYIEQRWELKL